MNEVKNNEKSAKENNEQKIGRVRFGENRRKNEKKYGKGKNETKLAWIVQNQVFAEATASSTQYNVPIKRRRDLMKEKIKRTKEERD